MAFELPALPYAKNALEPHISEETLDFHHGKHHNTYVVNLNGLVDGTENASKSLEEIIMDSAGDASKAGLFNNAAQIWNHTFYWNCMTPNGGGKPEGKVLEMIEDAFGSYEKFREEFKTACLTQFGSGWGWLVLKDGKMAIQKTLGADLPMAHGNKALLTCDVWEHAYYIDFRNRRPDYVDTFLDHLVNWEFVASQL
ncbi:superoxide dismutase [Aestuariispira insulae]|uniref:Superoxide dismutase n=1 Tax=Aestuariispira insulae TaxID=1461337 RepID=A0A3D9HXR9_9PROT|nr:superoxide dismutase [Aestuariispira insulae]RED54205.1 Fe-Mn family superoxide dismutase [Aestuariispira insulae]